MEEKLRPCSDTKKLMPCSDTKKLRPCSDSKYLRPCSDSTNLRPCSASKEQKQQLILAHLGVLGRKSEFYVLDLETERITKTPVAVLLNQGAAGAYTVLSGSKIYVIGGQYLESRIIPKLIVGDHHIHLGASCAELLIPQDGNIQTTDPDPAVHPDTDANAVARKGGLVLESTRFQAAPCMLNPLFAPYCAVLEGRIYTFTDAGIGLLVHMFDPQVGEWKDLPFLPSSERHYPLQRAVDYLDVSDPILPDEKNRRLVLRVKCISTLFAFYPATATWECLAHDFWPWSQATTLLDDVIYFHMQKKPDCLSAYDLTSKTWLKVVYSEYFPAAYCIAEFLNMLHLGNNVMCLANSCTYKEGNQPLKTNLQFILFRVQRTSPEEVLVTLVGGKCFTFDGKIRAKHYILL